MPTRLWEMGATDLAHAIRTKQASVREVIQDHLDRIAEVNSAVNAVTVVLDEGSLQAADAADQAIAAGDDIGPLHGVPMTVKENIDLMGSATTHGIVAFKDAISPEDAPHIAQLKQAGAIPIARTNMPDFGLRWHTDNDLHGATINPWDTSRTPGGSSGGDGVALATGMTALGMGNDYAGSLRLPALCTGVVGLRPTTGRVPRIPAYAPQGRAPRTLTSQLSSVHGPMARRIRDLRLALENMSAYDPRDALWMPAPLHGPSPTMPIKVAMTIDPAGLGVDPTVAETVQKAAATLEDAGYIVEAVEPPHITEAMRLFRKLISVEVGKMTLPVIKPLVSDDAALFLENSFALDPMPSFGDYLQVLARRNLLANDWAAFLADYPLILGPVLTTQSFLVGDDLRDGDALRVLADSMRLTPVVNFFGLPSVALPIQVKDGMPQGVQLIGDRFREDLCLDAAEAIEDRLGVLTPIAPR